MTKAIDAAAKFAARKAKPRLKTGTRDLAKPKGAVSLSSPKWDQGATGQANRQDLVTEERGDRDPDTGKVINPNGVKGVRRVDMLETYHQRGVISDRGYTAGEALRDAWAGTQRSRGTDYSAPIVDSTSKPDAHIGIQIDRVSRYLDVSKRIAPQDKAILTAVVSEGRAIAHLLEYRGLSHDRGKVHLREALERLADAMGM